MASYKQLETSREIRQWLKTGISLVATVGLIDKMSNDSKLTKKALEASKEIWTKGKTKLNDFLKVEERKEEKELSEKINKMYQSGCTIPYISAELKLSDSEVKRLLKHKIMQF